MRAMALLETKPMGVALQTRVHHGRSAAGLADLVDGIGTEEFGARLVRLLHEVCGADHCAIFRLGGETITALAVGSFDTTQPSTPMVERYLREGLWRKDPAMAMARSQAAAEGGSLIHVDLNDTGYSALRPRIYEEVKDRVVLCGRRNDIEFGLSVVRTHADPFHPGELDQLACMSETLVAAMAKHISVLAHRPNVATALTELSEIENCMAAHSELPRRELEVCARILYGISSIGISIDLGVGEESVKTYRKRAYQRLRIGSERELLHWYLAQWSAWRGHLYAPGRSTVH
jgi:DNA-binding CsgD family transcriptional regulator